MAEVAHEGTHPNARDYRSHNGALAILYCPMIVSPIFLIRISKGCQQSSNQSLLTPKAQHSENEDHASGPITSWEIDGETVSDFILGGSKITADGELQPSN